MSSETLQIIEPGRIGPYTIRGTVGEGAFSVVKLVYHNPTREFCACKIVPKSRINTPGLQQRFELEIRINQQLHHPGIVQIFDLLKDENNYYIVMEFCPNGELFQYIVDRERLSEQEARPIVRQVLETLKYIHDHGITHRDLKPENLLIDNTGVIKLSDFGLSRFIPQNGLVDTPCGSPCYASPECISGHSYNGRTTDVWSIGVIIYAMLTGQLPWTKRNQAQLFAQIKRGEYTIPTFLSTTCTNFLRSLMTVDINKRITIEKALLHPWLEGVPTQFPTQVTDRSAYVSLKLIDRIFDYDIIEDDLRNLNITREHSQTIFTFSRVQEWCKIQRSKDASPKKKPKAPPPEERVTTTAQPEIVKKKTSVHKNAISTKPSKTRIHTSLNQKPRPKVIIQSKPDIKKPVVHK